MFVMGGDRRAEFTDGKELKTQVSGRKNSGPRDLNELSQRAPSEAPGAHHAGRKSLRAHQLG